MPNERKTLVLLIGTNPLPNYVVAKYLINQKEIEKIILIHSNRSNEQLSTQIYAKQLDEFLKIDVSDIELIGINDLSSPKDIHDNLDTITKMPTYIHLNYTGGTKTMAVHIYNYFANNEYVKDIEFSYLDARKDTLLTHKKDDLKPKENNKISNNITINLLQLITLHNFRFYDKNDKENEKSNPAKNCFIEYESFINNYTDSTILKEFTSKLKYVKTSEDKSFDGEQNGLIKFNGFIIRKNFKALKYDGQYDSITKSSDLPHNIFSLNTPLQTTYKDYLLTYYATLDYFLNNKYFEHLCFKALEQAIDKFNVINPNHKITEFGTSFECISKSGNVKNFEIDLYFIKGYNLYGISCTTDSRRNMIKSKGFEIIHRTKQIAGEEARAIVITLPNNDLNRKELEAQGFSGTALENEIKMDNNKEQKSLQEELTEVTGTCNERFFVFHYRTQTELTKQLLFIMQKN